LVPGHTSPIGAPGIFYQHACFVVRDHDGQGLAYGMVRLSDAGFVTFLLAGLGQELKQQPKGHDKPE
jgi:hypothetical protein